MPAKVACLSLICLAALPGCEFPISAKDYRVEADPRAALIDTFATHDSDCARAVDQGCPGALSACLDESGCPEFSACVRELATPAARAECEGRLGTSLDAQWAYEDLLRCWSQLDSACSVGADFRCVGRYNRPASERTTLTLSERVHYLYAEQEPPDFALALCVQTSDCSEPIALASLDDAGHYTATVPWGPKLRGPGSEWQGYRLLTSPDIPPSRVESNLPVWGTRVGVTRVLKSDLIESIGDVFGVTRREAIFVQVVDCQSAPAPGIVVTLTDPTDGTVEHDGGGPVTTRTGAAAISDPKLNGVIEIVARRSAARGEVGTEIARHRVTLPEGHVSYLKMYPEAP